MSIQRRRDEFRALMQANDVVTDFVSEIYHRSGRRIWISENARAVRDWSGALLCYEGTVEDVTEKFEQERALRAALRQAEIANKMKAAFLAAMSHELKTPLNAVLGFSEIIRDEVLGPVGHEAYRDYAGDIHKSGARLLTVINDVLDVSRLEGGLADHRGAPRKRAGCGRKPPSSWRAASPSDERAASRSTCRPTCRRCMVDPRRLAQALGNLLANALKFTPPRAARCASPPACSRTAACSLSVEDTGIGMAQETIAAALEPFRQLDGSLARRFEGAGLGLSIAKALAELHGGSAEPGQRGGRGHHRHHHAAGVPRRCARAAKVA